MKFWGLTGLLLGVNLMVPVICEARESLFLAYPQNNYKTTSQSIFFIGTAAPQGQVLINGKAIARNNSGHFAPVFPLKVGKNQFTLTYQQETIKVNVIRLASAEELPPGASVVPNSLTPSNDIARLPGELICFEAIAAPEAKIFVEIGNQTVNLSPQKKLSVLPPNSALLTDSNQPQSLSQTIQQSGCITLNTVGDFGKPVFNIEGKGERISLKASGNVTIINPSTLEVVEVKAASGVTRTGPSTEYARLTPLPKGTRASVTGREGKWLRLDYGAWIKEEETLILPEQIPPKTIIRSINSKPSKDSTAIIFPLEAPIPISVQQTDNKITLNLYNTVSQTDVIRLDPNPVIKRLDWQQVTPTQVQYVFTMKNQQQWGYELRYEGTNLIFTIKNAPNASRQSSLPLEGIRILLDPGHGGKESGSLGPTGYPEKDATLVMSKLVKSELEKKGATVFLTRSKDTFLSLDDRVKMIQEIKPDLSLSLHYNALPDGGNPVKTKGVSVFWYHPQAHEVSMFLQDYLVKKLKRSSYGLYWKNLALTRPATSPSLLLELGFMINPDEFDWIVNPKAQLTVAEAIANGLTEWFQQVN